MKAGILRGLPGRFAVLGCLCAVLAAQEAPPRVPRNLDTIDQLPGLLFEDAKFVISAPARWDGEQWTGAALLGLAVVGTGLVLDRSVDQAVLRNRRPGWNNPAKAIQELGGTGGLVLMAGGYLGSSLLGQDEARSLWVDAGMATLLARGVISVPVKFLAGRYRPDQDRGSTHFAPFSSGDSLPSGHAAQAFALASVISLRCDNPWVGATAYGLAGLVGLARLEQRGHFTSDVLAGALIGSFTGRAVVRFNNGLRQGRSLAEWTLQPTWSPQCKGLSLQARF